MTWTPVRLLPGIERFVEQSWQGERTGVRLDAGPPGPGGDNLVAAVAPDVGRPAVADVRPLLVGRRDGVLHRQGIDHVAVAVIDRIGHARLDPVEAVGS